jgi:hypothetical protein
VKDRGYAPPTIAELERLFAGEYEKFRAQNPRSGNRPVVTVHHQLEDGELNTSAFHLLVKYNL